jgi:hypothetical protein
MPALDLKLPRLSPEALLKPDSLLPDQITSDVDGLIEAGNRILFAPRQNSIGEAIVADLYDDVIGIIPFIGDAVGNGSRTAIAKSHGDEEAAFFHGLDLILGVVPEIGDVAGALLPANQILYMRKAPDCLGGSKLERDKIMECMFPNDSLERMFIKRMREMRERDVS